MRRALNRPKRRSPARAVASKGHDIGHKPVKGTLAQCEASCCGKAACVAFSRTKALGPNAVAECYLKSAAPAADRTAGHTGYVTFVKGARCVATGYSFDRKALPSTFSTAQCEGMSSHVS